MANETESKEIERQKRIKAETKRLKALFKELDANKLKTVNALIDRAAFITISLQDVEAQLNATGWTEQYNNGGGQNGVKRAAAADVHISLTKNLTAIMKLLADLVPAAPKKKSKLQELMDE